MEWLRRWTVHPGFDSEATARLKVLLEALVADQPFHYKQAGASRLLFDHLKTG